jgi:PBP1b-binding outer membrane lipoprotein LpoB
MMVHSSLGMNHKNSKEKQMKKILFLILAAMLMVACSDDDAPAEQPGVTRLSCVNGTFNDVTVAMNDTNNHVDANKSSWEMNNTASGHQQVQSLFWKVLLCQSKDSTVYMYLSLADVTKATWSFSDKGSNRSAGDRCYLDLPTPTLF